MITPHILAISLFLSVVWGWHLRDAAGDWTEARRARPVSRRQLAETFRNLVAALSLESIALAYVLRTAIVLAGFGEAVGGQVAFFALVGVNVTGAIFVVASRRFG